MGDIAAFTFTLDSTLTGLTRFYTHSSEEIFMQDTIILLHSANNVTSFNGIYTLSLLEAIGSIVYMDANYVPTRHLN